MDTGTGSETETESEGTPGPSRRQVVRGGYLVAAGAGAGWLLSARAPALAADVLPGSAADPEAATDVGTTTGPAVTAHTSANLGVSVSPDGKRLAVDVTGGIRVMSAGGGTARLITPEDHDATRPHWSPDGSRILFQSFVRGVYDVWAVRPDGTGLAQLTDGPGYDLEPRFSPDGTRVAFSSDREGESRVWVLDTRDGTLRSVTGADAVYTSPAWSPDGGTLAYLVGNTTVEAVDLATGKRRTLVTAPDGTLLYASLYTPDGKDIAHIRAKGAAADLYFGERPVVTGEDLPPLPVAFVSDREFFHTSGGRVRRRPMTGAARDIPFAAVLPYATRRYRRTPRDLVSRGTRKAKGIVAPVQSRDGRQVAFRALNALWVMPVGGRPRKVVDDGYGNTDPDFAPDGRSFVYVSDRAGTANLWHHDLATAADTRLTDLGNAQLTPRYSPDGRKIAYQDESGAIWVYDIAADAATQVLPTLYQPGRPCWSPDGTKIAVAALMPYSRRTETGHNQVLVVDLGTGALSYQAIAPQRSLSTRGDDGPLWTSDGRYLVFGAESLGWRVPVDPAGRITGPPVQITTEVTDSLSVSGDGRTVTYLCNGRLRATGIDGGRARTLPVDLTYRPVQVSEATVVRAGALWDGTSDHLRRDVDIVVRDGLIEEVVHRGGAARAGHTVDASGLTVMPGLIDTHNHWHMRGRQWGDRQGRLWLSYGVTTSRSPGDPAYQMAETRESAEAGTRVGPRFLGSGEALDGTRVSYNCMRTVMSAEQLERELDRAQGLEYDLLKCYMRLSVPLARRVVERAHARGVPVTSHYLYPAAHSGLDGMEHPGGGHRLGYSRTLSFARVHMSQDSVDLLTASGMWNSTTTIFASELFVGDRSLIEDERTRVLFPDWEYKRLVAKADSAGKPGADTDENHLLTVGMVDALLRVHRAGGLVVCGTDAPLDDLGISIHQNLRALVKYGFTPREALMTATGNAATALGYGSRLGAVAPGRIADLVAVQGDPLTDIHAAAAVRTVLVSGVARTVPEILAPFQKPGGPESGDKKPAGRTTRVRAAAPSTAHDDAYYWHRPDWSVKGCCHQ